MQIKGHVHLHVWRCAWQDQVWEEIVDEQRNLETGWGQIRSQGTIESARMRNQKMIAAHSYHKMNWEVERRIKERESVALLRKQRRQLRWMTWRKCMTPWNCSVDRKAPKANPLRTRKAQSWLMLINRWREHFQEVLNRPPPEIQPDLPEVPPLAIRTGPITRVEVKKYTEDLGLEKESGF